MSFPFVLLKNMPYELNEESLFEMLKQFGNILELRVGNSSETKGQAIVIYTTLKAAQLAIDKLKGVNYQGRYLVVSLYTPEQSNLDLITSLIE